MHEDTVRSGRLGWSCAWFWADAARRKRKRCRSWSLATRRSWPPIRSWSTHSRPNTQTSMLSCAMWRLGR